MRTLLIVGLGNPGSEYEGMRHNVGFAFLDKLAGAANADDFTYEKKCDALVARGRLSVPQNTRNKGVSVVLAKPQSFVNRSGQVVAKLKRIAKIKTRDIIIVHDDLDIAFGKCKLSFAKNSGGHRGVESIMQTLKTKAFFRLRIGTASAALRRAYHQSEKKKNEFIKDFVLSRFTPKEKAALGEVFKKARDLLTMRELAA